MAGPSFPSELRDCLAILDEAPAELYDMGTANKLYPAYKARVDACEEAAGSAHLELSAFRDVERLLSGSAFTRSILPIPRCGRRLELRRGLAEGRGSAPAIKRSPLGLEAERAIGQSGRVGADATPNRLSPTGCDPRDPSEKTYNSLGKRKRSLRSVMKSGELWQAGNAAGIWAGRELAERAVLRQWQSPASSERPMPELHVAVAADRTRIVKQ